MNTAPVAWVPQGDTPWARGAATALAASSEHSPVELARRVASPGGTTQAGIDVLDADRRLVRLLEDTLRGARDRSVEMTEQARAAAK